MDTEIYLTKEQLTALDAEIDALIPTFELLRTNRKLALREILTEFDAFIQGFGDNPDLSRRMLAYRNA